MFQRKRWMVKTNWETRNTVVFKQISSESGVIDVQKCSIWINNIYQRISKIIHQTKFLWTKINAYLKKTFIFKVQSWLSGKHQQRKSNTLIRNEYKSDTKKLKSFLIGNFFKFEQLPLNYYMKKILYNDWIL